MKMNVVHLSQRNFQLTCVKDVCNMCCTDMARNTESVKF